MSRPRKTTRQSFKGTDSVTLRFRVEGELANVLALIAGKFMEKGANEENAAAALLQVALCDYERILAKCLTIERYCEAENIDQHEYRLSVIRAKFPKGRLPKVRLN